MDRQCAGATAKRQLERGRRAVARAAIAAVLLTALPAGGATISNTARLAYLDPAGGPISQLSNTVTFQTAPGATPGVVSLFRYAPSSGGAKPTQADGAQCGDGAGGFSPAPPIKEVAGQAIDLAAPVPLVDTGWYHAGEPVFVTLADPNRDADPLARETIDVQITTSAGDQEALRLRETGPDTGLFAGAIQSARLPPAVASFDCQLSLPENGTVTTDYVDATDSSDKSEDQAVVDPFGYAFDSASGAPVDGAIITLIDDHTGQPAAVFGDDGTSAFPSSVTTGGSATDAGGTPYVFPTGGYRFPFVPSGDYHFVITPPPTHSAPSTVPASALANAENPITHAPYVITAGSFGDAFVLTPGPTMRIDVPLDPLGSGGLALEKQASREQVSAGDFVQYQLRLRNASATDATGVQLTDVLPFGFRYRKGSVRIGDQRAPDPQNGGDGRTLVFAAGPDSGPLGVAAGAALHVTYVLEVTAGAHPGDAVNRAIATAAGNRSSNPASAVVRVKEPFFGNCAVLVGRVVEGECTTPQEELGGVRNVRVLLDDGTYTSSDANGQFHFEGVCDGTHVVQLDLESLPPGYEAIPCIQNTRFAGRSFSQFVDVQGGTLWRTDFYLHRKASAAAAEVPAPHEDAVPAPAPLPAAEGPLEARRRAIPDDATAAGGKTDWLAEAVRAPGTGFLFPPEGHNPRAPALRVAIRHDPGQRVVLAIGGTPVDALAFDGTVTSADGRAAVSVWRGIPLAEGDSELTAQIVDASGNTVRTLTRTVHFANTPARAELVPEQSALVADGISRPVIAVRLLDGDGKPVRAGVTGPFSIGPPYVTQDMIDRQQTRQLAGLDRFQPTYRIEGDDGIAYLELQPTTESGEVVLDFAFQSDRELEHNARRQQLRVWLDAVQRDWVLVGFAEGTLGYETLSGNMQAAEGAGHEDDVVTDGQLSFYAKGRVLGKWLLTLSYRSDERDRDPVRRRETLEQVIDPDEYYTIYGDGAEQRYGAPTQHKLYVKLERPQFYALFGDFETGLTQTELARYSRSLSGFKSEYGGSRFSYDAFVADTSQRFARDEIQGDGTSGLYRLSGRHIVINSEKIAIETRDRFQSHKVVSSRYLLRHIDYDIDYTNGTLFFREPIFSRDTDLNPIFIVADYEVQAGGNAELNAGGRAAAKFLDGRVETGLSYIRDAETAGETDLGGVDLKVKLLPDTELRLEAAGSDGEVGGDDRRGGAYLAEIEHAGQSFDSVVYARRQAPEFGVGQQFSAENGQEKQGLLGRVPFAENWAIVGEGFRQENLQTDVNRLAGVARLERSIDKGKLFGGVQYAQDEDAGGKKFESQQVVLGANRRFLADKLDLLGQADISVNGKDDSLDFPSRYLAQAGYDVTKEVKLIVAEEVTSGAAFDSQTTRAGAIVNPWKGAKLSSTLNQDLGEYGPRTFGLFGLTQSVLVGKQWAVDVGVDQSSTFAGSDRKPPPRVNPGYPIAAGSGIGTASPTGTPGVFGLSTEDFTAVSAGATYRADLWSINGRGELRDGESDDRWGIVANFLREARAGVAFASSGRYFQAKRASGTEGLFGSVDLSWAYRPLGSRWSLLDRLEFRLDQLNDGTGIAGSGLFGSNSLVAPGDAISRAVVNNFNLNRVSRAWTVKDRHGNLFELNQRNQWSLYYGSKYSFDEYDGESYTGYTDLVGAEWRFDLKTWLDVGLQGAMLHSWNADNYQFSAGPSIGVSPMANSWISVGYNVVGFRDSDFDAARYTAQGVIVKLRIKFDQLTRLPGRDREDPRAADARNSVVWPLGAGGEPR
jgi:uncharacterized repeat protein (TIGR01451 family)